MAATVCPVTRERFLETAQDILFEPSGGESIVLQPREFSTGSFGWAFNGKVKMTVDGKEATVSANINLVMVGSKNL